MPLIDMGYKRAIRNFQQLHNKKIEVGLLDNTDNMASIWFWNEYGTSRIPERPAFRTALRLNQENYKRFILQRIRMMITGSIAPLTILENLGNRIVRDLQKSIIDWSDPPNAESTVKQKGFNDPLVNTGLMWVLIKYKLV